jgi:hypothetical protein
MAERSVPSEKKPKNLAMATTVMVLSFLVTVIGVAYHMSAIMMFGILGLIVGAVLYYLFRVGNWMKRD